MLNFEQYNPIKKYPDLKQKESLKDTTFKFSEEEKKEKIKSGLSEEKIKRKEKEVIERQKMFREEEKENKESITEPANNQKKISFEKFKIKQEIEFQKKLKAARQRKNAAYENEGRRVA